MQVRWQPPMELGSEAHRVRFGEEPRTEANAGGRRLMFVDEHPAFDLSFWCGTCPFLFERLEGTTQTFSRDSHTAVEVETDEDLNVDAVLDRGLDELDDAVIQRFGGLLEPGRYLPLLLKVEPRLVRPSDPDDYFTREHLATWGLDGYWGLPTSPRTPYFRTFSTPIDADTHLYEFIVPMVPPTWNDRTRVQHYATELIRNSKPTAVAVSTLDICAPAVDDRSTDYHAHWGLTHFLLDGHHKLEAAATAGRPLQLLALVSLEAGLASAEDVLQIPDLRSRRPQARPSAHPSTENAV